MRSSHDISAVVALATQGSRQTRQIFHLRSLPDGARRPLDGEIVLGGVKRQEALQIERVRMVWIKRKGLLATHLRVEILPAPDVADAGLIECSGRLAGRIFRFPGRDCPGTFGIAHRQNFGFSVR
jgi:hypothetical protein